MFKNILIALTVIMSEPSFAAVGGYKIKGYLGTGDQAKHVVIEAGRRSGVTSGEVFRAVRPAKGGVSSPVETGVLKIVAVYENDAIAEVTQQGTLQSETIYGNYAEVMAGDLAVAQRISITRAKVLAPEVAIKFSAIFDDPKAQPSTYEFTPGGRSELRKMGEELARLKAGMLMIEGHTDQKGNSEQNQIESYQRALAVRQYLIGELGFDETRVTAIGLGESEPISDVILPGNAERARRIVFKVVPMPSAH